MVCYLYGREKGKKVNVPPKGQFCFILRIAYFAIPSVPFCLITEYFLWKLCCLRLKVKHWRMHDLLKMSFWKSGVQIFECIFSYFFLEKNLFKNRFPFANLLLVLGGNNHSNQTGNKVIDGLPTNLSSRPKNPVNGGPP